MRTINGRIGSRVGPCSLATPLVTFSAMVLFAAFIAIALRIAWNPPIGTYVEYVPIGAVLAGLVWDRLFPTYIDARAAWFDVVTVGLAAMRAIAPPLPFASGHTLLSAYAAITARHAPLRVVALLVLAHVVYEKLFLSGGATSMLIGLLMAAGFAALRRQFENRRFLFKTEEPG